MGQYINVKIDRTALAKLEICDQAFVFSNDEVMLRCVDTLGLIRVSKRDFAELVFGGE